MAPAFWEIDSVRLGTESRTVLEPRVLRAREVRSAADARAGELLSASDGRRLALKKGQAVELAFTAPPPVPGATRTVAVQIRGYYEFDIGGRIWLNPVAITRHRSGTASLPRFALERLRQPRS